MIDPITAIAAASAAYKGLNAIENALIDQQTYLGATLHRVNKHLDGGEIICQIKSKINPHINFERACKISYIQKFNVCLSICPSVLNFNFKISIRVSYSV
mgnify:CR=1 FL=1